MVAINGLSNANTDPAPRDVAQGYAQPLAARAEVEAIRRDAAIAGDSAVKRGASDGGKGAVGGKAAGDWSGSHGGHEDDDDLSIPEWLTQEWIDKNPCAGELLFFAPHGSHADKYRQGPGCPFARDKYTAELKKEDIKAGYYDTDVWNGIKDINDASVLKGDAAVKAYEEKIGGTVEDQMKESVWGDEGDKGGDDGGEADKSGEADKGGDKGGEADKGGDKDSGKNDAGVDCRATLYFAAPPGSNKDKYRNPAGCPFGIDKYTEELRQEDIKNGFFPPDNAEEAPKKDKDPGHDADPDWVKKLIGKVHDNSISGQSWRDHWASKSSKWGSGTKVGSGIKPQVTNWKDQEQGHHKRGGQQHASPHVLKGGKWVPANDGQQVSNTFSSSSSSSWSGSWSYSYEWNYTKSYYENWSQCGRLTDCAKDNSDKKDESGHKLPVAPACDLGSEHGFRRHRWWDFTKDFDTNWKLCRQITECDNEEGDKDLGKGDQDTGKDQGDSGKDQGDSGKDQGDSGKDQGDQDTGKDQGDSGKDQGDQDTGKDQGDKDTGKKDPVDAGKIEIGASPDPNKDYGTNDVGTNCNIVNLVGAPPGSVRDRYRQAAGCPFGVDKIPAVEAAEEAAKASEHGDKDTGDNKDDGSRDQVDCGVKNAVGYPPGSVEDRYREPAGCPFGVDKIPEVKAREEAERKAREEAERKKAEEDAKSTGDDKDDGKDELDCGWENAGGFPPGSVEDRYRQQAGCPFGVDKIPEVKAREEAERKAREVAERKKAEEDAKITGDDNDDGKDQVDCGVKNAVGYPPGSVEDRYREPAGCPFGVDKIPEVKAREEAERKQAEDDAAKKQAEEDARKQAEETARKQAEETARQQAEETARKQAEETARQQAEETARKQAEETARQQAEEDARKQAEETARKQAEEDARKKAEEDARQQGDKDQGGDRDDDNDDGGHGVIIGGGKDRGDGKGHGDGKIIIGGGKDRGDGRGDGKGHGDGKVIIGGGKDRGDGRGDGKGHGDGKITIGDKEKGYQGDNKETGGRKDAHWGSHGWGYDQDYDDGKGGHKDQGSGGKDKGSGGHKVIIGGGQDKSGGHGGWGGKDQGSGGGKVIVGGGKDKSGGHGGWGGKDQGSGGGKVIIGGGKDKSGGHGGWGGKDQGKSGGHGGWGGKDQGSGCGDCKLGGGIKQKSRQKSHGYKQFFRRDDRIEERASSSANVVKKLSVVATIAGFALTGLAM